MQRYIVTLAIVLLASIQAEAAPRLIAVLPLDIRNTQGKMDVPARSALEDLLRDEAANALTSDGWTVLTGENTYALLRDNGIDPAQCDQSECHLQTARELNVSYFLSGVVQFVDGGFIASVRLMEAKTGRIMGSAHLEGANTRALLKDFQEHAPEFFRHCGLATAQPGAAPPPPPQPDTPVAKPQEPVRVTPPPPPIAAAPVAAAPIAAAPRQEVPAAALQPAPVAHHKGSLTWGCVSLGAAVAVGGVSGYFDHSLAQTTDGKVKAVDFAPVGGYAVALGLAALGIYELVAR